MLPDKVNLIIKYRKKLQSLRKKQANLGTSEASPGLYLLLQGEITAYICIIEDLEGQLTLKL